MSRAHTHSTRVLAALVAVLGVVVLVSTIIRGGGPLSVGVLMGVGLIAFGGARLYLSGVMRDDR